MDGLGDTSVFPMTLRSPLAIDFAWKAPRSCRRSPTEPVTDITSANAHALSDADAAGHHDGAVFVDARINRLPTTRSFSKLRVRMHPWTR